MAAVHNSITSALTLFGVLSDTRDIIFNGSHAYDSITNEVFNNNFNTCIALNLYNINENWNTYVSLTVAEGRTRLRLRTKVIIRDFVHWVRENIRMSDDPAANPFPTRENDDII